MIYIKSIFVVLLNNNKFLPISTCINFKKKIKHKHNKNLSTAITLTQNLLIRPTKKKKNTKQILSITKKKKKLEGPNLTPSPGRVQAALMINWKVINKVTKPAREGPNKQSYLKFLTNKMAQIFIILYLIPDTVRWAVETWERRRAENQREAEAVQLDQPSRRRSFKLAALLEPWALSRCLLSRWEQTEQWRLETRAEAESRD